MPGSKTDAAPFQNRRIHGWAWLGLTLTLALHVWDEASHDFLSLYDRSRSVSGKPCLSCRFRSSRFASGWRGSSAPSSCSCCSPRSCSGEHPGPAARHTCSACSCSSMVAVTFSVQSSHPGFWPARIPRRCWFLPPSLSSSPSRERIARREAPSRRKRKPLPLDRHSRIADPAIGRCSRWKVLPGRAIAIRRRAVPAVKMSVVRPPP
jgi:hypothetical protein